MLRRSIPALLFALIAVPAMSIAQTSEWRLGGRVLYVSAEATSEIVGDTGYQLKLDSGPGIEFDANVMFSERFGAEFSIGTSAHRLKAIETDCCSLDGGRVWLVPITAIALYHHPIYGEWDPYIGLGVGWYPPFYSISGDLQNTDVERLDFDGEVGLAFQIGVNYQLDNRWYANFNLRSTQVALEARVTSSGTDYPPVKLNINPFTIGLGIGYKY